MTVFGTYAQFYDTLYQDKDYEAECDFLEQIFARYAQAPIRTILDLGCGTGGHALPLARRGYEVVGVDRSERMLAEARRKVLATGDDGSQTIDERPSSVVHRPSSIVFHQGDIRTLDLGRAFDAVIAMFAVISYQTTNEDLAAAFRTARRHLNSGGLFIFDAWFGPAVLTQRPVDRYKVVEVDGERVIRFAHPELDIWSHTVKVNYKVLRLKDGCVLDEVDECHVMRFLFPQEIAHSFKQASFQLLNLCPFMALDAIPSVGDWNVLVIGRAS